MEKPLSAYRGDGPYIFVCYAHEDSDAVFREIAWLNDYGVNVWYDEGITPGQEWTDELASAIQGCTQVFFFVTPSSVESGHCRRELNFAHEEGREVVAIHLQETEMPPGLRLSLNNRQGILRHNLADDEFHKLLMRVVHGSGGPAEPSTSTSGADTSWPRFGLIAAAVTLTAVAVGVWWLWTREVANVDARPDAVPAVGEVAPLEVLRNSIAVLPFENLSPDPNNAYFARGGSSGSGVARISDVTLAAGVGSRTLTRHELVYPDVTTHPEMNFGADMNFGNFRFLDSDNRLLQMPLINRNNLPWALGHPWAAYANSMITRL